MTGSVYVPFVGPSDARIFIVGEAPGAEEELAGKPFVGGAGRLLDNYLQRAGIPRESCMIGNVCAYRPDNNDFSTLPSELVVRGIAALKEKIRSVRPNIVITLGNEPLFALTGKTGITNWRGSLLYSDELSCKILPTIHPAFLMRLRDTKMAPLFLFDLKKAADNSLSPVYAPRPRHYTLAPSLEQSLTYLDTLEQRGRPVAFDLETTRLPVLEVSAISFSDDPETAISIPFLKTCTTEMRSIPYWTLDEELIVLRRIQRFLNTARIRRLLRTASSTWVC